MSKRSAVLVTDITSYKAVVVSRFLKRHYPTLRIVSTDHRPISRWLSSRWSDRHIVLPVGPDAGRAYAEAIARVLQDSDAEILLPVNSKEISVLMQHRDLLGAPFAYMGDEETYRKLDDKFAFATLLERLDLPRPAVYPSLDAPPPLVLKPARGSSAAGVLYLRDRRAIDDAVEKVGETPAGYVIQEYVAGEGVGYSGYFEHGRIAVGFAHRRVAEYPVTGGSSVVREAYPYADVAELRSMVERILAVALWSGFAMFELKRRADGSFVFIECNPRIWGSIHQGLACGVNYFAPLLGPVDRAPVRRELRTELFPLSLLSLAGYLRQGRMDVVREVLAGWRRTRTDVGPFSDPCGFLALLARGL